MSSYGIDLPGIFQAAQQTRHAQLQQQAMESQVEQAKQQFEAKRAEVAQRAAQEEAEKREQLTGVMQSHLAQKLQQDPSLAPMLQQHVDRLVQANKINPIQLPSYGEQPVADGLQGPPAMGVDPRQVQQFALEAQEGAAMRGEKPPEPRQTNDMIDFERARQDPAYAAFLREQQRGRSTNINIGKDLPVSAVTDIADASTAIGTIDDLLASFNRQVPASGIIDQAGSRASSYIPNTDTAIYQKEADVAAQVVGTFLEGGKLAEGDYGRYRSYMPQPGDSPETAQKKAENLKRMIAKRSAARSKSLSGSGYRVPAGGQTPQSPPVAPSADDLEALWGQ